MDVGDVDGVVVVGGVVVVVGVISGAVVACDVVVVEPPNAGNATVTMRGMGSGATARARVWREEHAGLRCRASLARAAMAVVGGWPAPPARILRAWRARLLGVQAHTAGSSPLGAGR